MTVLECMGKGERMTIKELSQLYYLQKEINFIDNRIIDIDSQLTNVTQTVTDMPKAGGSNDKIGKLTTELVYQKEMLAIKKMQYATEETRLIGYINSINDSFIRLIFNLRFIELKSWNEVANAVGGGNTEYSVKQQCYRFLRKN